MNKYVVTIRELVGRVEEERSVVVESASAEQVDIAIAKSYDEKDWKKVLGYSIYPVGTIPVIVYYGMR